MSTRFTALTVREGDAFLLEDNGWKCLFDSGKDGLIVDLLQKKGINILDLAICSHNDADHANGFIELFDSGFQIKEIWLPGLWASVLHFVKENCENGGEVELDNESFDGELDTLFSEKSVSEDSFNRDLSFLDEMKNSEKFQEFCDCLHDKLAHHITENHSFDCRLWRMIIEEYVEGDWEEEVDDYIKRVLEYCFPWDDVHFIDHVDFRIKDYLRERLYRMLKHPELTLRGIKKSLDINLENIISIATKAKQHNCTIRWFEPSQSCTNEVVDYGFVSLNSSRMCSIRMPKSSMAYMHLLKLTKVNKYSLVFEYKKEKDPLIRFSADSNCTCQSVPSYRENIIVTAPHHGSSANANVYNSIQGNDLIWVRSDKLTDIRPCTEFKNRKNKYCLACKKNNFISEICFEYNTWSKRWDHVRGEQCRCK